MLYEPGLDFLRGEREAFKYVTENPRGITPDEANDFASSLFSEYQICRKSGYEIHEWQMLKYKYEYLGIKFSISYPEIEKIIWDNTSFGAKMPGVEEMLSYLKDRNIRTGIISNIGWSGKALENRVDRLLPNNEFEFVIASSEYGFRKPSARLFQLALNKAGLSAEEVWYCGDKIDADVFGANGVGMFPVLYENLEVESPWKGHNDGLKVDCEYWHIHKWDELICELEKL